MSADRRATVGRIRGSGKHLGSLSVPLHSLITIHRELRDPDVWAAIDEYPLAAVT
jgi:hypothetical protein